MPIEKLTKIRSTAVPLPFENVDTDQIIPARFLKSTTRDGFGDNLFRDWRYDTNNHPLPDFVLNQERYSGEILVAGKNFGSGSSREHAAWAIADYGFKVVISSFFADIFNNNALNNGIVPVQISPGFLTGIMKWVQDNPAMIIEVDVEKQTISVPQHNISESFEINPYKKHCLLNGLDDIDYVLTMKGKIADYEKSSKK